MVWMNADINYKSNFVIIVLADWDVISFVYEVPFIFWHYLSYINVDEVSWITVKTLLQMRGNYYKMWQLSFNITKCDGQLLQRDLITDTTAILNLSDLRSIMGCPGGIRSVFTRAFRAKRELQRIFLWKKAIIITSKHGTKFFFTYYNLFLGKLKEKLARKAGANTDASISDRTDAPWASHNTP